jgi:uncharacterized membrane protein
MILQKVQIGLTISLAIVFAISGSIKAFVKKERLPSVGVKGLESLSGLAIRSLGFLELAGCCALIIPMLLHSAQWLSTLAKICFAVLMVAATLYHLKRNEGKDSIVTISILTICIVAIVIDLKAM